MEERDWLILKLLYDKKNITKTAQSLYISQPSLSKRIQQIEKDFKTTILLRGTKGVQFTPQGEYLAKCAEEMLVQMRRIREEVVNMEQEVTGTLRIGVSNFITMHKLPRLLELFRKQYPRVEFKVITGWSRDVFHMVYNQEVHVGIVRGEYQWPDGKHLLFKENICIISREKITLEELPTLPRIDYDTDTLLRGLIDNWWSSTYSQPPLIGMEVDKAETCKEMVLHGLGYGILPSVLVEQNPVLHKINITDKSNNPIIRNTWMFYHEHALEMKFIHAFVEFVKGIDFYKDV